MGDELQVRPRLAPPLPDGYTAPATAGLNQSPPLLDSRELAKPREAKDDLSPYARRDVANNFRGKAQYNMRLRGWREAYQIVTAPGALDIANFSYFIIRSVGAASFAISVPDPVIQNDPETGDPILEAWGITIDIEYTGAGAPVFSNVTLPNDGDQPSWTSEAGKLDTVVVTWAGRWLLRESSFSYTI